ncbi:MAG: hypothetical protein QMD86_02285 [Patescibacteria group bacterium]|nr:hypothetical protein [Patescibacteria group bacterium]
MFNFLLQIILMLSLGVMVYLAARKVPQISDTIEETGNPHFFGKFDRILGALPLEKLDYLFSQFLEKNIRKMKLFLMKFDNYLNRHLEKFKTAKHIRKHSKKFALFDEGGNNAKVADNLQENSLLEENEKQEKLF